MPTRRSGYDRRRKQRLYTRTRLSSSGTPRGLSNFRSVSSRARTPRSSEMREMLTKSRNSIHDFHRTHFTRRRTSPPVLRRPRSI